MIYQMSNGGSLERKTDVTELLSPFYSLESVLLLVCAGSYYKAADVENSSPLLWSGLSVLVFLLTWRLCGWGLPGNLLGQALLFGAITAIRVLRDREKPS
jgi:hypothetical protein